MQGIMLCRSKGGQLKRLPGCDARASWVPAMRIVQPKTHCTTSASPSASLPGAMRSAAALTSGWALPIATPKPAARIMGMSFTSSPTAQYLGVADSPVAGQMLDAAPFRHARRGDFAHVAHIGRTSQHMYVQITRIACSNSVCSTSISARTHGKQEKMPGGGSSTSVGSKR